MEELLSDHHCDTDPLRVSVIQRVTLCLTLLL